MAANVTCQLFSQSGVIEVDFNFYKFVIVQGALKLGVDGVSYPFFGNGDNRLQAVAEGAEFFFAGV